MQEEVENRSVNLAVQTSKVTLQTILKGLKKAYDHHQNKKLTKETDTAVKGEQTVKELIGQGDGVKTMDLNDSGIRDFKKTANKYGVDFAIVKEKVDGKPKYTCFFKAKDADAILKIMDEYGNKRVKKKDRVEEKAERPSVLDKLKKFKDYVAKLPRKDKEKRKDIER